jgi:hypothetical protein
MKKHVRPAISFDNTILKAEVQKWLRGQAIPSGAKAWKICGKTED